MITAASFARLAICAGLCAAPPIGVTPPISPPSTVLPNECRAWWCGESSVPDPHRFRLASTGKITGVSGTVTLVPAWSPFGVAVTVDGHTTYDLTITADGLPAASSLGTYTTYVAWLTTPDLDRVENLGAIASGRPIVAQSSWNKLVIFISAERSARAAKWSGPLVLVGRSPSALMQSFVDHPFYNTGAPPF